MKKLLLILALASMLLVSCQEQIIDKSERKADCISFCASKGMSLADDENCYQTSVEGYGEKTFCRCEGVV